MIGGQHSHPSGVDLLSVVDPSHEEKPIHPPRLPPLCYDRTLHIFRGDDLIINFNQFNHIAANAKGGTEDGHSFVTFPHG